MLQNIIVQIAHGQALQAAERHGGGWLHPTVDNTCQTTINGAAPVGVVGHF